MKDNYDIKNLNPRKNPYVNKLDEKEDYIEYKGYRTYMKYDASDNILVGELLGISNVVAFHGNSIDEFISIFHRTVDNYIDSCKELGRDMRPKYDFSGATKNPYVSGPVDVVTKYFEENVMNLIQRNIE